jgi:hypothetical protein
MIYLIASPAFKDNNDFNSGFEILLKIGYTKEDSKKSRFDTYITENPTCKILYLIEGGTQRDEKNLHYHFKHLKVNYGQEWFKYDQEIIEFFEKHKTKESLKELKRVYSEKEKSQISLILSDHKKQSHINYLINKIRECGYEFQYRELLMEMSLSYDRIGEYIKENYYEIDDDFCLREEIDDTLRDFYKQPNISDKYEYLCSLNVSTSLSCLSYLPESFVNYYTVLGPDKMRALRYNATDMRKAYENLLGDQLVDVRTPILSEFLVGEKYTKTDIKNKLKRIYDSVGYSKTPKAVDLGDYFIISTCRIQNIETGKRDAGYLIVSIKEGD